MQITCYSCPSLMKLEFSRQNFEKSSNFMKTHPMKDELFLADGRTDMKKLIVALRYSAITLDKKLFRKP